MASMLENLPTCVTRQRSLQCKATLQGPPVYRRLQQGISVYDIKWVDWSLQASEPPVVSWVLDQLFDSDLLWSKMLSSATWHCSMFFCGSVPQIFAKLISFSSLGCGWLWVPLHVCLSSKMTDCDAWLKLIANVHHRSMLWPVEFLNCHCHSPGFGECCETGHVICWGQVWTA